MSESEEEEHDRSVKITVVGEPSTGKSSLCSRYLSSCYQANTQGADIKAGVCFGVSPHAVVQLCDVAGNTLQTHMLGNYLYDSDIVIFVYDLTNLQSFEELTEWIDRVNELLATESKKPLMALFGNKSDLEHQRAVKLSRVDKFAQQHKMAVFKGSANTGEMVNYAITRLVATVLGVKLKHPLLPESKKSPFHVPSPPRRDSLDKENGVSSQPLILNRQALRKICRAKDSGVCSLQ